ncbi:MAG: hypothetical protein ACRETB_07025 [Steroidobacteraceae bacterium]
MSPKPEPFPPRDPDATTAERRRTAIVVHDDRGNGRVEWVDVPPIVERTTLSVEESHPVGRPEKGYDPYQMTARSPRKDASVATGQTSRRDLRQLSEWIKQMRRLEEWKRAEGESAEEAAQAPPAKGDEGPPGDGQG